MLQDIRTALGRSISVITVCTLLFVVSSVSQVMAAGGQVQYRSVKMSDNAISGTTITSGVGSGTNVTYRVTFQAASNYTIKGIILDFCSGVGGTPFIGDSACPKPTGFSIPGTPTIDTTDYASGGVTTTGLGSTANWTASSINSGRTLKMTNTTGVALTKPASPTDDNTTFYTFSVTGLTNPNGDENAADDPGPPIVKKYKPGTFYARLVTYASASGDIDSYTESSPGSYQDYGGFALNTANTVQITAKVQETLVYCILGSTDPVTPTAPTSCTDTAATYPAITLGHGDNNTLDAFAVDTNYVYSYASTNALSGIIVRIHNANSCGGLKIDGTTTCGIPAVNAGAATTPVSALTAGTAAFGVAISSNSDVAASAPYDGDPLNGYYGMDTTTTGANVTTTFGSKALSSTGPINNIGNTWTFAATASATTAAGIYQANLSTIATGTF